MTTPLSFIELTQDPGGNLATRSGSVPVDEVDDLIHQHVLRGHGLRVYARNEAWKSSLFSTFPVVLKSVLKELFEPARPTQLQQIVELIATQREWFATFNVKRGQLQVLDVTTAGSLDALVEAWNRGKGLNEVLIELNATRDLLDRLARDLESPAEAPASRDSVAATIAPPTPLPADTDASAARRADLASDWLDARAVGDALGSRASNASQLASRYRKEGKLLGVWIRPERAYRYPPWQFAGGQPKPQVRRLLGLLRNEETGVAGPADKGGWLEIEWLYAPHVLLGGKAPASLMDSDPDRVVEIARMEFMDGARAGG